MLFNPREIQAMMILLNRTPLTAAEQLYAQGFFQRLTAFCSPSPEEPEPELELEPAPEPDASPSQKKAPGEGKEKGK